MMKKPHILLLVLFICSTASAADLNQYKGKKPAEINWETHKYAVIATEHPANMPFLGWTRYSKETKGKVEGNVAEFTVEKRGLVGVWACFYRANDRKYSRGAWLKECWTREDFVKNGWSKVATDGKITDWYVRDCKKGEKWKIRCSKYSGIFIFASPLDKHDAQNNNGWHLGNPEKIQIKDPNKIPSKKDRAALPLSKKDQAALPVVQGVEHTWDTGLLRNITGRKKN